MKHIVLWGAVLLGSMCEAKNKDADLSFEAFKKQYNLSDTTTEQHNPITESLSQTFQENKIEGLKLLHAVDKQVVKGLEDFNKTYLEPLSKAIAQALQKGGRVFLVGSGSSGRIGIDLAAKWKDYWKDGPKSKQVIAVMAGGVRAIVQAKEGFEDSEEEGRKALKSHNPTEHDVVILISASGSAKYNIGFGREGVEAKSTVYYFHNSAKVPPRTQVLFDELGVKKLLVDTGPQAISGSTRLQAATVAELCLGATFMKVINGVKKISTNHDYVKELKSANTLIEKEFFDIAHIIEAGVKAFSSGGANFRKLKDETGAAYITILGDQHSIREVLVDATETAPTFSTNPPRSIHETHKKKAEFRAYLLNETDNEQAWKTLSGYALFSNLDKQEVGEMCVAEGATGFGSFGDRPKGEGNLVMVALKSKPSTETLSRLKEIRQAGGKLALIYLSPSSDVLSEQEKEVFHTTVHLPLDQRDPLGVIQTVALKQTLNMISNGIMLGMHKVIGNRMIDLRLANQKLIYRSIRIIKDLMKDSKITLAKHSDEDLYKMLLEANDYKTRKESEEGVYVPTPVKVVLTQVSKNVDLKQAVQILYDNGESV